MLGIALPDDARGAVAAALADLDVPDDYERVKAQLAGG